MPAKVPKRVLSAREIILQVMGEEAALRFDSAVARSSRHRIVSVDDQDLRIAQAVLNGETVSDTVTKQRVVGALNVVLRKVVFENDKIRGLVLRQITELQGIVTEIVRETMPVGEPKRSYVRKKGQAGTCPVCDQKTKSIPIHIGRMNDKAHKAYKKEARSA